MKNYIFISTFLLLFFGKVYSDTIDKNLLPELFSPSNAGTDFVLGFVPVYYNSIDNFNIVNFYFSSSSDVKVRFRVPKAYIDTVVYVKANRVSEFSMQAKYAIPDPKILKDTTKPETVYEGRAIIISSDYPIIVYAMVRLRDYTEGFLALPQSAWSLDYNISTYSDYTNNTNAFAPATAVVVSGYDNTRVTFKLGGNVDSRVMLANGDSLIAGQSVQRTLSKGDAWVIYGYRSGNDLSGSFIRGNRPIAVFTGNYCAQVPSNLVPCKYLIEQELPIQSYSKRYFVTPIKGRTKGSMVKVTSQSVESQIMLNGVLKGTISSITGIENEGYLSFRVNNNNDPAVISSNNRINVSQYNTGNEAFEDKGLPFKMQVLSNDHFAKVLKFNTPSTKQSEYYLNNYLNIVLKLDANGEIPDNIELTEFVDGVPNAKLLRDIAKSLPVPFPEKESDGTQYYCLTIDLPQSGNYVLRSAEPIGAVMYGKNVNDTYGLIAGIKLVNNDRINDKQAPLITTTEYQNGNFTGSIIDQPSQTNIRSNLALVHLIIDSSYNFEFLPDTFIPGTNASITFDLRPFNVSFPAQAYLRAVDFAGNDTIVKYYYSNIAILPKIKIKNFKDSILCQLTDYVVDFDVTDAQFQTNNVFRVKLGKVSNDLPGLPITLSSAQSTSIRSLTFSLPSYLPSGDDYFMYIEGTVPSVKSDTILNLKVNEMPDLSISGYSKVFSDNIYQYKTQNTSLLINWNAVNGTIVGLSDATTVSVKWNSAETGKLTLNYSSENNCTIERKLDVVIAPDNGNSIEGPDVACRNEEIFYNSGINNGTFNWSVVGGEIVGNKEQHLIRVKWLNSGEGIINLIHTDVNGFIKEMSITVNILELPIKPVITAIDSILSSSASAGNQWFYNAEIIAGARARTYNAGSKEGIYTVQVTESGCKSDFSEAYNYNGTSVLESNDKGHISLYPNPASDIINIVINKNIQQRIKISLCNILMSELDVISDEFPLESVISYSTTNLSNGVYFVKLEYAGLTEYYKFLVAN